MAVHRCIQGRTVKRKSLIKTFSFIFFFFFVCCLSYPFENLLTGYYVRRFVCLFVFVIFKILTRNDVDDDDDDEFDVFKFF